MDMIVHVMTQLYRHVMYMYISIVYFLDDQKIPSHIDTCTHVFTYTHSAAAYITFAVM